MLLRLTVPISVIRKLSSIDRVTQRSTWAIVGQHQDYRRT